MPHSPEKLEENRLEEIRDQTNRMKQKAKDDARVLEKLKTKERTLGDRGLMQRINRLERKIRDLEGSN